MPRVIGAGPLILDVRPLHTSHQMNTKILLILVALLQIMPSPKSLAADTPKSNEQRVRDYVAAFNEQNIDSMLSMATDDIQWLMVAGDKITVETQGKAQLRASMTAYFKSTKAKSELEWIQVTASRVAGTTGLPFSRSPW